MLTALLLFSSPALAEGEGSSSTPAVECPSPTTLSVLQDAYARGEQSFANLDIEGLNQASDDAAQALPCLSESITLNDAAAYHRLMGMSAFANQERDRVKAEFHAARLLQPGYAVPEDVAPQGHPMIAAYDEAVLLDEGAHEEPVPPLGGYVTVGGVRGATRRANSPAIIQVFEGDGSITLTLHLGPGQVMPMFGPPPLTETRSLRVPMLVATAATGAVALGTYGAAAKFRSDFQDPATAEEDLSDLYVRNRVSFFTSMGMGAATLALGTVTVVVW